MRLSSPLLAGLCSTLVAPAAAFGSARDWTVSQFKNFITFGDSYTDENRLSYFAENNGSAPPPGTFFPESFSTGGGGRTWARYVVQYTGKTEGGQWDPQLTLYDYAVSGAVCSNLITPRWFHTTNAPFPDLDLYEVPAFLADRNADRNGTHSPYFEPALDTANSVYAMWDGTNDIGVYAFLTDSEIPGFTLVDYTDCIYQQWDRLYAAGGRYFVLMNLVPLNLAPLYANQSYGGIPVSKYWPDKPANLTAIENKMEQYIALTNNAWVYRTPYEVLLANRYPGAHWANFDVHSLFMDMYTHPTHYFNGSAPANVTGYVQHCTPDYSVCITLDSPDSFMWYDELHPTEQTDRIVAGEFVKVLGGTSKYATYF